MGRRTKNNDLAYAAIRIITKDYGLVVAAAALALPGLGTLVSQ